MTTFIMEVFLFNLIFIVFLLIARRYFSINTPVIITTGLMALLCTATSPYCVALLPYPQEALYLSCIILFGFVILVIMGKKVLHPAHSTAEEGFSENTLTQDKILLATQQAKSNTIEPKQEQAETMSQKNEMLESQDSQKTVALTGQVQDQEKDHQDAQEVNILEDQENSLQETVRLEEPSVKEINSYTEKEKSDQHSEQESLISEPPISDTIINGNEIIPVAELESKTDTSSIGQDKLAQLNISLSNNQNIDAISPAPEITPVYKVTNNNTNPVHLDNAPDAIEITKDNQENFIAPNNLNQLITQGFIYKKAGNYKQAIKTFTIALQSQQHPKLSVLILLEISEIYKSVGQTWQAAELLKILLTTWITELDKEIIIKLKHRISNLEMQL